MTETLWMAVIGAGGIGGAAALRRSWKGRGKAGAPWKLIGWLVFALSTALSVAVFGTMRGLFVALTLIGLAALLVVASGFQVREQRVKRNRSLAPEPVERASSLWRGTLRWLLALPIGMVAAMGIGIFYSAWSGGEPQTRLVVGGLLTPVVWGACMAWTLADNRILRALAFLVAVIAFGFGLSILKGF